MENLVPLGTGNSRLMKSNIPPNTTLAQLIQMWNNGTFPYDIGPLNSAGISQQGTPLTKDTLLKDATAALFGLGTDAVPDDALSAINTLIDGKASIVTGSYVGTGTYGPGNPNSITADFPIKLAIIIRYSSGRNMITPEFSSMSQAFLTTSFVNGAGFPYNTSDLTYGKMSSDGKTYSWYHSTNVNYQQNTSGYTYYYVLFV